ncbi:MAG: hypothetical protein AB1521_09680 [Bacteroidota bacterium]
MKKYLCLLLLILSSLIIIQSCKKDAGPTEPEQPNQENIKIGTVIDITTQTIGTGGGTITISKPDAPINGMQMTIQPNSFSATQNFNISYAPITSHNFDQDFSPESPLIKISSATEFASRDINFKIPITINTGEIAMAFIYNDNDGTLEGLPINDLTNEYIEFSTRRLFSNPSTAKRLFNNDEHTNLVIFSVLESKLEGKTMLATGFEPGVDDWEFRNRGSYISPNGNCAGQSVTGLWYYSEKKIKGNGSLFHKYDKICDANNADFLWQDNPRGYRFASVVQKDFNMSPEGIREKYEFQEKDERFVWWSLIMAIVLTKEPQFLVVHNKNKPEAHAVVVYKIGLTDRKIYIADPNYPGNKNLFTTYNSVSKKIEPYTTKLSADAPNLTFNNFAFFGRYIFIDKTKIDYRWNQFENGTIGSGIFPDYSIIDNKDNSIIYDGYTSGEALLTLSCRAVCSSCITGTANLQPFAIIDTNGVYIVQEQDVIANSGKGTIQLKEGKNKFGFIIYGYAIAGSNPDYIDFKWITINYNPAQNQLLINPSQLNATLYGRYTFNVSYTGTLPSNYVVWWYCNDDAVMHSIQNGLSFKHQFKSEGNYKIYVDLYDNTQPNPPKIGSAVGNITVARGALSDLYNTAYIFLRIEGECEKENTDYTGFSFSINTTVIGSIAKLEWDGTNFSSNYSYSEPAMTGTGDSLKYTGNINGTVSNDGSTISTFNLTQNIKHNRTPYKSDFSTNLINLPLQKIEYSGSYKLLFLLKGADVQNHVVGLSWSVFTLDTNTNEWKTISLRRFIYNANSELQLDFYP